MKEIHNSPLDGSKKYQVSHGTGYEEALGRIVMAMLRDGLPVSRKSLCLKIAFLMNGAQEPAEELLYEGILRMLLSPGRTL